MRIGLRVALILCCSLGCRAAKDHYAHKLTTRALGARGKVETTEELLMESDRPFRQDMTEIIRALKGESDAGEEAGGAENHQEGI